MKPKYELDASGPSRIRQRNRDAVLHHIRFNGAASRTNLAYVLNLSGAAVSSVVAELVDDGLLQETSSAPPSGRLGRPVSLLELSPDAAYTLGLVLRPVPGGVDVQSAWADYSGGVQVVDSVSVLEATERESILDGIEEAVTRLQAAVPDENQISSIVVGIPGVVDENNRIINVPRLRVLEGGNFIDEVKKRIPASCTLNFKNDINLATIAELYHRPVLRDQNFAYLFIGTGVGAGISLGGDIWSSYGWAGEVGQIRITRTGRRRENFEELLGTDGWLADTLEDIGLRRTDLQAFAASASAGDARAVEALDDYAANLADLAQILNGVLDLDEIVVDYPSPVLLDHIIRNAQEIMADVPMKVTLTRPSIGHTAAARGAAFTALGHALSAVQRRDVG